MIIYLSRKTFQLLYSDSLFKKSTNRTKQILLAFYGRDSQQKRIINQQTRIDNIKWNAAQVFFVKNRR